jgi:hypothetical protein
VRRLEPGTFGLLPLLKSICIAASVEFLGKECFIGQTDAGRRRGTPLEHVTFEPGSQLREIESGAFSGCNALKGLRIPASVETMTARSLPPAAFPVFSGGQIEIDPGNQHFGQSNGFLIDFPNHSILRYSGNDREVVIGDEIEKLDEDCFYASKKLRIVHFGQQSHLRAIETAAFRNCWALKSITIPSPVTFIGDFCFMGVGLLASVTFCPGSQLKWVGEGTFFGCTSLKSLVLPSSTETIRASCFWHCVSLENSPLPVDSAVIRIEESAFSACHKFTSFIIPSTVEFVGENCFVHSDAIASFTFGSPSHLRELLDIPHRLSGFISVPDSVETLSFSPIPKGSDRLVLGFGNDSKLQAIKARQNEFNILPQAFLQVLSRHLKLFRQNMEFEPHAWCFMPWSHPALPPQTAIDTGMSSRMLITVENPVIWRRRSDVDRI